MTPKAQGALGIVGLVALAGLGAWLGREPRALMVDNPGRRRRRRRAPPPDVHREIAACERAAARSGGAQTFRRKKQAVRALLDANPDLLELVERDCGHDCKAFDAWEARGRRGPKPRARRGDGRFDALNERWERRTPGRKVASWKEALAVTAPSSRRWEDFRSRVPVLEEAVGGRLNLPEPAERLERARLLAERCQDIEEALGPGVEVIPF